MIFAYHKKSLSPKPLEDKNIMPQASPSHLSTGKATGIIVVSASPEPFFATLGHVDAKKGGATDMPTRNGKKKHAKKYISIDLCIYISICSKNIHVFYAISTYSNVYQVHCSEFQNFSHQGWLPITPPPIILWPLWRLTMCCWISLLVDGKRLT